VSARRVDRLHAANIWERALERLERLAALDATALHLQDSIRRAIGDGPVRDALSGTWLGHPAHPMFTDLPIGFWTSSFVLDLVGGRRSRDASELLVALGVVSALPTVATGAADYSDTRGGARRVGIVHAAANASAVGLYAWSWRARRRQRHKTGVALGLLGATAATVGGMLGNHLLSRRGVGVDATSRIEGPATWAPAVASDLVSPEPTAVLVEGVPLVVLSRGDHVLAVTGTCPHRGGPLAEGSFDGETVTCPWHGSCFSLFDGSLRRGPATMPLPRYETRTTDGAVEVRAVLT
jgi:nitrite reductase/ring-hydroxylating ferredoxin subunit/uncharacterized membrane protein